MLPSPSRHRGHRVAIPAIVVIAFVTCVIKYLLIGNTGDQLGMKNSVIERKINGQQVVVVQMDTQLLTPIRVSGREGEMIVSVNSDDLDDIAEKVTTKEVPLLPNLLIHNPDICHNIPQLHFLLYVHSAPGNRIKRDLVRRTYGNTKLFKDRNFVVVFVLGLPTEFGVQELVKKEFDEHGDIVQGYFIDDYRNMTLKAVMALNWIHSHCNEAAFALKVDDDSFLNIFQILPLIEATVAENRTLFLACPLWTEGTMEILRNRKTCMKWCVTKRELAGDFYPRYCAGISYAMSQALIQQLKDRAKKTPFFWIDDVYITGLLAQPLRDQIHYVNLMTHFELHDDIGLMLYRNTSKPLQKYIIHARTPTVFASLWNLLLQRLTPEERNMANDQALRHLR